MPRKKNHQEFVEEVFNIVGEEYSVLGEYLSTHSKILMLHNICGCTWEIEPNAFLRGNGCPKCGKNKQILSQTKTHDEFIREVETLKGKDEYCVLEKYVNSHTKILIRHNFCGYEWMVSPLSFLKNKGCPKCSMKTMGDKKRKSQEFFEGEMFDIWGNEYTVLGKYVSDSKKILIRHNVCDYEWDVVAGSILAGYGCPYCDGKVVSDKNRFSILCPEIALEWHKSKNGNLTPDDVSYGSHKKVWWLCSKCQFEWQSEVASRACGGNGCPQCNSSRGEKYIYNWLSKNNIYSKDEFIFEDCKNKRVLPFDFYIPKYNLCIEYHGEQHYKPIKFFGGEKQFKLQKKLDEIKVKYCKDNNIPLLIIPYWEFDNIEEILKQTLFG